MLSVGPYLEMGELKYTGNIEAGAIYKFIDDKPVVTGSLFIDANTTDRNYLAGLQTGDNSWGFKPGAGVGWSFPKSWMSFYLGGDIRTNNYSSSILSELEIGFKPWNFFYIAANSGMRQSLKNGGDCDCTTVYTALYQNEREYSLIRTRRRFRIAIDAAIATHNGRIMNGPNSGTGLAKSN